MPNVVGVHQEGATPTSSIESAIEKTLGTNTDVDIEPWIIRALASAGWSKSKAKSSKLGRLSAKLDQPLRRFHLTEAQMNALAQDLEAQGASLTDSQRAEIKKTIERIIDRSRLKSISASTQIQAWIDSIKNPLREVILRLSDPNDGPSVRKSIADALAPTIASDHNHVPVFPDQGVMLFLGEPAPSYEVMRQIFNDMLYLLSVMERAQPTRKSGARGKSCARVEKTWALWSLAILWERTIGKAPTAPRPNYDKYGITGPFAAWVKKIGDFAHQPFRDYLIKEVVDNHDHALDLSRDSLLANLASRRFPLRDNK
jgi:hypothetical protein